MYKWIVLDHGGVNLDYVVCWEDDGEAELLTVSFAVAQALVVGDIAQTFLHSKVFQGADRRRLLTCFAVAAVATEER